MSGDAWLVIAVVALGTLVIKGAGPVLLGGRPLPPRAGAVIALLAPALLAALVLVDTFSRDGRLQTDERVLGVAAAGAVLLAGRGMVPAVVAAAAVTAAARALL